MELEQVRASVVQVRSGCRGGGVFAVQEAVTESWLLTSDRVVAGQEAVTLRTSGGKSAPAQVMARPPEFDLARLSTPASFSAIRLGQAARLGEPVSALGHPWRQPWTLTHGVISGLGRLQLDGRPEADFLRSDVSLAPGNSGGPEHPGGGAGHQQHGLAGRARGGRPD